VHGVKVVLSEICDIYLTSMKREAMPALGYSIMKRVRAPGRGQRVFAAKDFLDLGGRAAVDQALSRLAKAGVLRRVARGLYDWPRQSALLGVAAPADLDAALAAVARKTGQAIIRDDLSAAYAMGLTTAVPTRLNFVTAGRGTDLVLDGRQVKLGPAPAAVRPWIGSRAAPIVQALVWARAASIPLDSAAKTIGQHAPKAAKDDLARNLGRLPGWALGAARRIVENRANTVA
jgi:hypothetical protein